MIERGVASLRVTALLAGVSLGALWTLSPMTVVFVCGLVPLVWWGASGLNERERRSFTGLIVVAALLRVAAVAGLFLAANPNAGSFATFFGDEQYLELRALWQRNLLLHIPISREAFLYSGNGTGWTSFISVLAWLQLLIGPSPYGVRLFNTLLSLAGGIWLFRVVRRSYGSGAALGGLALLLWLPSLFVWSISALKEPVYLLMAIAALLLTVVAFRGATWTRRAAAVTMIFVAIRAIETVRPGSATLALGGIAVGLSLRVLAWNRRVAAVSAVMLPLVIAAALTRPTVQRELLLGAKFGANWHRGHVFTPGRVFKLLDERFYDPGFYDVDFHTMTHDEAARFVVRALVAFVTVPRPDMIESRAELAFVPEQMVLYCILVLLPIGIVAGARKDPLVTSLMGGYALVSAAAIAMVSGNIGTLVRHRALVIPYVVWFSALGALEAARWMARHPAQSAGRAAGPPEPFQRMNRA